jgi:molybdenum cofactor biosynthesis enzyme MoaA
MSNALKILITWDCNLDCDYCCNKQKEVKESFKPITYQQISESNYDTYQITGGEPLLKSCRDKLFATLSMIPKGKPVYLYTNGVYLTYHLAQILKMHKVKGINIGWHQQPINWDELREINKHIPIRLWVQDIETESPVGFEIRYWHMNDCGESKAERVYLENIK